MLACHPCTDFCRVWHSNHILPPRMVMILKVRLVSSLEYESPIACIPQWKLIDKENKQVVEGPVTGNTAFIYYIRLIKGLPFYGFPLGGKSINLHQRVWERDFEKSTPYSFGSCFVNLMHAAKILNKCSVEPETSISPSGKGQGPTSFSERGLFFSEIGQLSDRA